MNELLRGPDHQAIALTGLSAHPRPPMLVDLYAMEKLDFDPGL
jgi:hypothetical protein